VSRGVADNVTSPPWGRSSVGRAPAWHAGGSWVRVPSPPLLSGFVRCWRTLGFTLGGFVAGEGSFAVTDRRKPFVRDGSPRLRWVFGVKVAARDRPMLEALQMYLGCGSIRDMPAPKAHHQPQSGFEIVDCKLHHQAVIPFAEQFLLPCHKRTQFERWRDALYEYERRRPSQYGRGRSTCSVPGCERPVRGRGLCRSHYYRATGY
jgi:hypothetical protein